MGRLTTHVLDLVSGRPAAGMRVRLLRGGDTLADVSTNADGRCAKPLLDEGGFATGDYVIAFHVADYFQTKGAIKDAPFFNVVEIACSLSDETMNYHVPLLVSPYGYSTYRGS